LGGDGADEVFGGYKHYQAFRFAQFYQYIPEQFRKDILSPLMDKWVASQPPGSARLRANQWQNRIADSNLPLREMLANKYAVTKTAMLEQLMPDVSSLFLPSDRSCANLIPFGDALTSFGQAQYADLMFHQLNDMLIKVDRMSMANSLETRHPYLDHKVVEFAFTLPVNLKLRGFQTKAILRDIAARYLPVQNARKKKQGFVVPISYWLREELWQEAREQILSSNCIRQYVSIKVVESVLEQHKIGLSDHNELIWCLLIMAAWHRNYLEC
jgi:asparagine synthase (glutamine-hydrolysing)